MTKQQVLDASIGTLYFRIKELNDSGLIDGGSELELKAVKDRLNYLEDELEKSQDCIEENL